MENPISAAIQEQLENSILKGLRLEWQAIHQNLPEDHRSRMRLPAFRLTNGLHPLASWIAADHLMSFSRNFVLEEDWGSLVEVLRHEMAHQLATTFSGVDQEPPHGRLFREACDILHADPRATTRLGRDRLLQNAGKDTTPHDRLIRKVRLLMQLAESANPHESAQAAAKANALIIKYNLDILATDETRNFISLFLGKPALRHGGHIVGITALLEAHYFVEVVWVSAYVLEKGKMGRVPEVSGTLPNVRIASYVFDYLLQYIALQWDQYRRQNPVKPRDRAGFTLGIVDGFRKTLDSRKTKTLQDYSRTVPDRNLMVLEDQRLKTYVGERYNGVRSFKRASRIDPTAYSAGKMIGEKLVISKGIDHKPVKSGKYLPQ